MPNLLNKLAVVTVFAAALSSLAAAQSISTVIHFDAPTNGISADPIRNKVYVVAPQPGGVAVNLAVIDGSTNTVITSIPLPTGAFFPAVDYFANKIYVAGCNYRVQPVSCIVTVVDGKTDTVVATIPVTTTLGGGLAGITVNPLTRLVYVANASDNVIDIISGLQNKLVGSISLNGNSPSAIALNPVLNLLYVPYGTNQTAVVDAWQKKIVTTATFGFDTVGAAVNPFTGNVFVTDQEENGPSLTGVLTSNGTLTASVVVGDNPLGVDVDPITNLAFVASTSENQIDVINGSTNTLTSTVSGVPGQYVAVNIGTQTVYVSGTNGVTVLTEN
jgi:DNA-binding beta-propeller fold protein YncE